MAKASQDILRQVREAAAKHIFFTPHALNQMNAPEEMISTQEVRSAIFYGEIVEDYPEDVRGHSCLMMGRGNGGRPIHIVCAPKPDYLAVITAYVPTLERWESDWRARRRK